MRLIYLLLLLAGIVELGIGLGQCVNVLVEDWSYQTVTGTFGNPGPYSVFVAVILPVEWAYVLRLRTFGRVGFGEKALIALSVAYALLSLVVLPLSMSRTSWIAAVAGCGAVTYLYVRRAGRARLANRLMGVTFCLAVCCVVWSYGLKKDSADGRLLIWKISISMIRERFPEGVGEGRFAGAYGEAQEAYFREGKGTEREGYIAGAPSFAYNEYLQVMAESGLCGLLTLLLVVGYSLYNLKRSERPDKIAVSGALAALMVAAFFSYPLRNPYTFLLSVCVLLSAVCFPRGTERKSTRTACYVAFVLGMCVFTVRTGVRYGLWGDGRTARRQWESLKPYFSEGRFGDIVGNYAVLYPYLKRDAAYLFEYGQCLSQTGAYEESNRVLREGLERSSDPMFLNIMGKNFHCLGKDALAEEAFRKAAYRIPHKVYPLYLLMELYRTRGCEEEWRAIARRILDRKEKVASPETEYIKTKVREALSSVRCGV